VSFNILTLVAPITVALAAYYLCHELTSVITASAFGGGLVGFVSYETAQSLGHLNLDFTVAVPLLIWIAILRYRERIRARTYVILTGLLVVFEFGISIEVVAPATVFGCVTLVVIAIFVPDSRSGSGAWPRNSCLPTLARR
jgi:hypothetical protein